MHCEKRPERQSDFDWVQDVQSWDGHASGDSRSAADSMAPSRRLPDWCFLQSPALVTRDSRSVPCKKIVSHHTGLLAAPQAINNNIDG